MRNNKKLREDAYDNMRKVLEPYHARCIAEWHDKKRQDDIYIWLLCSRKADARDGEAYRWRGTICVRIMPDGSTHFFHDEGLVFSGLGQTGPDTWTRTEVVLDKLIPDLPPE